MIWLPVPLSPSTFLVPRPAVAWAARVPVDLLPCWASETVPRLEPTLPVDCLARVFLDPLPLCLLAVVVLWANDWPWMALILAHTSSFVRLLDPVLLVDVLPDVLCPVTELPTVDRLLAKLLDVLCCAPLC